MNRDTVIALAREAGFDVQAIDGSEEVLEQEGDYYERNPNIGYMVQTHTVQRFAALVAAAEREECAKVLEKLEQEWEDAELWASFKTIGIAIDAIRSRNA